MYKCLEYIILVDLFIEWKKTPKCRNMQHSCTGRQKSSEVTVLRQNKKCLFLRTTESPTVFIRYVFDFNLKIDPA